MAGSAPQVPTQTPPHSTDAEKTLLGALLIDREAINRVVDFLRPEDFYHRNHQHIYEAVISLFEKRDAIDVLSVSNVLAERGVLADIGGVGFLTSLASAVPSAAHASTYGRILQKKRTLRNLIDVAHEIIGLGYREDEDTETLLDEAERKLFAIGEKSRPQNFTALASSLDAAMERISTQDTGELRGLPTRHTKLDEMLGGFQRSDLVIIAARPSVGKTAFSIDIAGRLAANGTPVAIFSLEMSTDQVVDRFIASKSGVSLWKLRTGRLSHDGADNDFLRITTAISELKTTPVFIDDSASMNVLQMRAVARRLHAEHNLGAVVVDYLQLMAGRKDYDSAVQQVTEISRGLKGLAKELNIPVIALSQLSRAIESRDGHRPKLSDLRDSGSIEQDADVVMFIHRDDKVNFSKAQQENKLNMAQLIIAKHRNGPTGDIDFYIDPDSLQFYEVDRQHNYDGPATF
ncbi:MAG: replicative DNA helicase [Patescibacteria group bacterium]